jgi:transcriptional regulator with XRE-family HTH domain
MLGERIRELREAKGLVQRQIAAELEVDTAYISKIEKNEKPLSRSHLKRLSSILGISQNELYILWLADRISNLVKDEKEAMAALKIALKNISNK